MDLKFVLLLLLLLCCQSCTPPADVAEPERTVIRQQAGAQIALSYQPAKMLTESPLALDVEAPAGWRLNSARLVGISMEMPVLPLFFNQAPADVAERAHWQTQFLLGACADEQMTWRLELVFQDQTGAVQRLSDEFVVSRR